MGELQVEPAGRAPSLSTMARKASRLRFDPGQDASLDAVGGADRVAVQRIAAPEHRLTRGADGAEQRRQRGGDSLAPRPGDQGDPAGARAPD